jgi:uncharacterized protein YndB with AHSA1/START domain
MVLKILLGVLIVLAATLVIAAFKPSTFHLEKSVIIQARPEKVYELIADFHNWPRWAPQDREDSTMQRSYSGAANGLGAISDWVSKGRAGAGRMTITAAKAPSSVEVAVDWQRPFRVQNTHHFTLSDDQGRTQVTWIAEGTNLYLMKVMELFVGTDRLMGQHFEAGLTNLKTVAEQ